ncbi:MAG: hypothetical protein QM773_17770 [Hyphomonadaceae bacterium]
MFFVSITTRTVHTFLSIIVDASLRALADLDDMPEGRDFIPRLHVSKQGALLRPFVLVDRAHEQGRAIIDGAGRGESSIPRSRRPCTRQRHHRRANRYRTRLCPA